MHPYGPSDRILEFVRYLYVKRHLITELVKRDFKQQYIGNSLGLAWAIIDPLAMMLVFWFVRSTLWRSGHFTQVNFLAYLIVGIASYSYFQSAVSRATNSLQTYSFLIKRADLHAAVLPLISILSELLMHFIVIAIALIIVALSGVAPTFYWFQAVYYVFAVSLFMVGLCWITSAVAVFFQDIRNIVQILLRFLYFLTPIFWDPSLLSEKASGLLKINPIFYIVEGYRFSFLQQVPFWHNWQHGIYFWAWTLFLLLLGSSIFSRLRPHIADVI